MPALNIAPTLARLPDAHNVICSFRISISAEEISDRYPGVPAVRFTVSLITRFFSHNENHDAKSNCNICGF